MEKKVRLKNDQGDILYPITKAEYVEGLNNISESNSIIHLGDQDALDQLKKVITFKAEGVYSVGTVYLTNIKKCIIEYNGMLFIPEKPETDCAKDAYYDYEVALIGLYTQGDEYFNLTQEPVLKRLRLIFSKDLLDSKKQPTQFTVTTEEDLEIVNKSSFILIDLDASDAKEQLLSVCKDWTWYPSPDSYFSGEISSKVFFKKDDYIYALANNVGVTGSQDYVFRMTSINKCDDYAQKIGTLTINISTTQKVTYINSFTFTSEDFTQPDNYLWLDNKEVVVILDSLVYASTSSEFNDCFPNHTTAPSLSIFRNNIGKRVKVQAAPRSTTLYSYVTIMPYNATEGVMLAYPNTVYSKGTRILNNYLSLKGVTLTPGTSSGTYTVKEVNEQILFSTSNQLEPLNIGYLLKDGRKIDYNIISSASEIESYKDDILGIYFQKEGISVLIGKKQSKQYWSNGRLAVPSLDITTVNNSLNKYPDGQYLTNEIIKYVPSTEGWACKYCYNQRLGDEVSSKPGYLWSYREAMIIRKYYNQINYLLEIIGGNTFNNEIYWTSVPLTRKDNSTDPNVAWNYVCIVNPTSTYVDGGNVQGYYMARPIWKFESSSYIAPATPTSNGSMSAEDKIKLNKINFYQKLDNNPVTLGSGVRLGTNSLIESNVSISSGVTIDSNVKIGISNNMSSHSIIFSDGKEFNLDSLNSVTGDSSTDDCRVPASSQIGENVTIQSGITIGSNTRIQENVTIGTGISIELENDRVSNLKILVGEAGTLKIGTNPLCQSVIGDQATLGSNIHITSIGDLLQITNTGMHDLSIRLGTDTSATYIDNGAKIGHNVEIGWNNTHTIKFSDGTIIDFDSILKSANLAE